MACAQVVGAAAPADQPVRGTWPFLDLDDDAQLGRRPPSSSSGPLGTQPLQQRSAAATPDPWANFTPGKAIGTGGAQASAAQRSKSADRLLYRGAPERGAVMLNDVVKVLLDAGGPDATYVDCTFGRGGHAQELLRRLSREGRLLAFDYDPMTVPSARRLEKETSASSSTTDLMEILQRWCPTRTASWASFWTSAITVARMRIGPEACSHRSTALWTCA